MLDSEESGERPGAASHRRRAKAEGFDEDKVAGM